MVKQRVAVTSEVGCFKRVYGLANWKLGGVTETGKKGRGNGGWGERGNLVHTRPSGATRLLVRHRGRIHRRRRNAADCARNHRAVINLNRARYHCA